MLNVNTLGYLSRIRYEGRKLRNLKFRPFLTLSVVHSTCRAAVQAVKTELNGIVQGITTRRPSASKLLYCLSQPVYLKCLRWHWLKPVGSFPMYGRQTNLILGGGDCSWHLYLPGCCWVWETERNVCGRGGASKGTAYILLQIIQLLQKFKWHTHTHTHTQIR